MRSAHPHPHVCFVSNRRRDSLLPLPELRLRASDAEALAELLPVLICGEESAGMVFAHLSQVPDLAAAHAELSRIEHDEREHARLLLQVRRTLPAARSDPALSSAVRNFFLRLAERDVGRHLARIVALDSAVCLLLGALRHRRTTVGSEPTLGPLFGRIHRDEARHVLVARHHTRRLVDGQQAIAIARDTRSQLVELLTHRAAALEQLLRIDADRLFGRLRTPAPGLLG